MLGCMDLTGRRLWSQEVSSLNHAPTISGSFVVVASCDPPTLSTLDGPTGRVLWRTSLTHRPTTSPHVDADTILLGTERGLQKRSLVDGSVCDGVPPDTNGVSSDLVVARETIAFIDNAGQVVVISRQDGGVLRAHDGAIPGIAPLRCRERLLYASPAGLMVFSPDRPDEPPLLWVRTSRLGELTTPLVLSDSNVYAGVTGRGLARWGAVR
jgi:hypothetical protein